MFAISKSLSDVYSGIYKSQQIISTGKSKKLATQMLDVVTKNALCALVREAGLSYLLRTICHCAVKLLSHLCLRPSLVVQIVQNQPAMQETRV